MRRLQFIRLASIVAASVVSCYSAEESRSDREGTGEDFAYSQKVGLKFNRPGYADWDVAKRDWPGVEAEFLRALREQVASNDVSNLQTTLLVLGRIGSSVEARQALDPFLHSSDVRLRSLAIDALGRIGQRRDRIELVEALGPELGGMPDDLIQVAAAAVARSDTEFAIGYLQRELDRALARFESARTTSMIEAEAAIRRAAVILQALASMTVPKGQQHLRSKLGEIQSDFGRGPHWDLWVNTVTQELSVWGVYKPFDRSYLQSAPVRVRDREAEAHAEYVARSAQREDKKSEGGVGDNLAPAIDPKSTASAPAILWTSFGVGIVLILGAWLLSAKQRKRGAV